MRKHFWKTNPSQLPNIDYQKIEILEKYRMIFAGFAYKCKYVGYKP